MYKIFFNHKAHKGLSQRTQFSLSALCVRLLSLRRSLSEVEVSKLAPFFIKCLLDCFVHFDRFDKLTDHRLNAPPYNDENVTPSLRGTKQSRSSRLYLDCFVPRNDGDLTRHHSFLQGILPMPGARNDVPQVPSLRGTKQSRMSDFYYGFSISKKNLYFALKILLTTLMFSCGEPLMENDDNTLLPIVECYLQEGSDSLTVNIFSMEEFLKDDVKLSRPISKLKVTVNNLSLTETSSGAYSLHLGDDTLREGQTYNLQFNHNGKSIEAATTIPSRIHSLTVEPQSITLSSSYFWDISDTTQVVVSWDDPDNSFYQVYIESPNNPDMPSMGVFRRRMMQPFQRDSYRISTRELRSAGTHTIHVYRVGKDYAELYERVSASDLANPVSYIQNAFGIFTSISVAKITFRVYNES